jgi:two-component sensor histidine kinase
MEKLGPMAQEKSAQVSDLFESIEDTKAIETPELRSLLDHIPIAIAVSKFVAGDQRVCYANKAFEALAGRPVGSRAGRGWTILAGFVQESDPRSTLQNALLRGDEDFLGTFCLMAERPVVVEAYAGLIENEDGTENYRIAALIDVTNRARAEREELARQVRDKDLLLREVQHRVKNNLQLVISLIRLEARAQQRGDEVNLATLAGRIESLQLLYQALTPGSPDNEVDLGHYLSQIATAVVNISAVEGIRLKTNVDHAPMSINFALPVGLVVNELLTNSFKHAFGGREGGVISLECIREDETHFKVVVADDGAGLPAGSVWPPPGKISAFMVQTLRETTKARFNVESAPGRGVRVTISFAHEIPHRLPN